MFRLKIGGQANDSGGMAILYVNDNKVAEGRIERTRFSADDSADVSVDLTKPVVKGIGAESKSRFTGRIHKVTVEVK
jgi:arylsulfatase